MTNGYRLRSHFDSAATDQLMSRLHDLAAHPDVSGLVIDLGSLEPISQTYALWDENATNPIHANLVAASIRALVGITRTAYPNLEYLIVVGNDQIVPFWRIPDEVPLANEGSYMSFLSPESAVGAALGDSYFLSDDYYGSFNMLPWRGRGLALPEYGLGRLVETPAEMIASIDALLSAPVIPAQQGLVVGYDFLTDGAQAMAAALRPAVQTMNQLIGETWGASDLRSAWLQTRQDVSVINAHFEHWRAIPAQRSGGNVLASEVAASTVLAGTLNYSLGCHSGLSVPDCEATAHGTDFAQAILGRGGAWIANTGYGYGDADAVGYSEQLMTLFSRNLAEGISAGHALRRAKASYLNFTGIHSFSPYDEKVLAQTTLYGLPMMRIDVPESTRLALQDPPAAGRLTEPVEAWPGLTSRQVVFTPVFEPHSVNSGGITGSYYSVEDEIETNEGQPIQPRTSLDITLDSETPHGAFFEGGNYRTLASFDPVITRVITEDTDISIWQVEPPYDHRDIWQPAWWSLVNQVATPEGVKQRLVVIPAQYQSTTPQLGTERLFDLMNYTVYYSTTVDIVPPSIWRVDAFLEAGQTQISVEATDFSDVLRLAVSYTVGNGAWTTVNLTRSGNPNLWTGRIPDSRALQWFVQALDGAGNVAIHENKGRYFQQGERRYWFPIARLEH